MCLKLYSQIACLKLGQHIFLTSLRFYKNGRENVIIYNNVEIYTRFIIMTKNMISQMWMIEERFVYYCVFFDTVQLIK